MGKHDDLHYRLWVIESKIEALERLLSKVAGRVSRKVERIDPFEDERFYWLRNNAVGQNWNAVKQLTKDDPSVHEATNGLNETALHFLVIENELEAVEGLAKYGSDVNGKSTIAPIEEAARWGHDKMVDLLIRLGAKVDPEKIMEQAKENGKKGCARRIKKVLKRHGFFT